MGFSRKRAFLEIGWHPQIYSNCIFEDILGQKYVSRFRQCKNRPCETPHFGITVSTHFFTMVETNLEYCACETPQIETKKISKIVFVKPSD